MRKFFRSLVGYHGVSFFSLGLLISTLLFLRAGIVSASLPTSPAMGVSPSGIFSPSAGQLSARGNGMSIEFIDRATIRVRFDNSNERLFRDHPNSTAIGAFAGSYIRRDRTISAYGDRNTMSTIFLDNNTWESRNPHEGWRTLSGSAIRSAVGNGGMSLAIHPDNMGGFSPCDNPSHSIGLRNIGALMDGLGDDMVGWWCASSRHVANTSVADSIGNLGSVLQGSIENANITHTANTDASILQHVFPDNQAQGDHFVWCQGSNMYALGNCNNPFLGYRINEPQSRFQGDGSVLVQVTSDSNPNFQMRVGQSSSASSEVIDERNMSEGESDSPSCESHGGPFGWILCWVVEDLILGSLDFFADQIQQRLNVSVPQQDAMRGAWNNIRTIANIVFVMAFLVIIISQTLVGRF